jgi:hypothetical protein
MKDFYKSVLFYYILAPALLALWPVFLWLVYLPATAKAWARDRQRYEDAQPIIEEILTLDPDRLHITEGKATGDQFDYANAVQKVASLNRIPASNYKLASGMLISTSGQKSQSARVSLKDVNVTQIAGFLSTIQLHWPDLQCNTLKLTKRKDSADSWDADFDFKYYF